MTAHICFYRPNVAALVSEAPVCAMGGADLRAWEFARRLAARDEFRVSFVVGDWGQPAVAQREGVDIRVLTQPWRRHVATAYRQYRAALGQLRGGRFAGPTASLAKSLPWLVADRLLKTIGPSDAEPDFDRLLSTIAPDVLVCFGATPDSACLVDACGRLGVQNVVCVTGDSQLVDDLGTASTGRSTDQAAIRRVNESLAAATEIVVQTETQQRLVQERFHRRSHLVRNPLLPMPDAAPVGEPAVLWVGRAELVHKRPDRLWEVATKCPTIPFRVVMNPDAPGVWERLATEKPANVELIDRVPAHEMGGYFASAALLANTSASEGFPNAFLQAASLGVPVVSLKVDPDGFLSRNGCGVCCGGDLDKLAHELSSLWYDTERRADTGERARKYVATHHDPVGCAEQFADVLKQAAAQNRSKGAGIHTTPQELTSPQSVTG
jgi:glycosyltransferase involved in cell wall biosynthesis